jgi:hypothetical protein
MARPAVSAVICSKLTAIDIRMPQKSFPADGPAEKEQPDAGCSTAVFHCSCKSFEPLD